MKSQPNRPQNPTISAAKVAALRARFERCKEQIRELDWLSEGSVCENHPGTWRWTRKVKAKTVTVALAPAQAEAFLQAISNHRKLETLIQQMRALSQKYLLEAIAGPPRRPAAQNRPKPTLSKRHSALSELQRGRAALPVALPEGRLFFMRR